LDRNDSGLAGKAGWGRRRRIRAIRRGQSHDPSTATAWGGFQEVQSRTAIRNVVLVDFNHDENGDGSDEDAHDPQRSSRGRQDPGAPASARTVVPCPTFHKPLQLAARSPRPPLSSGSANQAALHHVRRRRGRWMEHKDAVSLKSPRPGSPLSPENALLRSPSLVIAPKAKRSVRARSPPPVVGRHVLESGITVRG
jgi:hypothetical protein